MNYDEINDDCFCCPITIPIATVVHADYIVEH